METFPHHSESNNFYHIILKPIMISIMAVNDYITVNMDTVRTISWKLDFILQFKLDIVSGSCVYDMNWNSITHLYI